MFLIKRTKGGRTHYATELLPNGHIGGLTPSRLDALQVSAESAQRTMDHYDIIGEARPAEAPNYGLLETVEVD